MILISGAKRGLSRRENADSFQVEYDAERASPLKAMVGLGPISTVAPSGMVANRVSADISHSARPRDSAALGLTLCITSIHLCIIPIIHYYYQSHPSLNVYQYSSISLSSAAASLADKVSGIWMNSSNNGMRLVSGGTWALV